MRMSRKRMMRMLNKYHPLQGQGFGQEDYQSRPAYATGVTAMTYLFNAMQETAPLRPSLLAVPFNTAQDFITYLNSVTPHVVWSIGDDIEKLEKDGSLVPDEVNAALLASADKLTETGGVWDKLKSTGVIYNAFQAEAAAWKLRHVWGGAKAGAGAVVEAVPTTLIEVGETAKTVAAGMQTVAKIAPYALGVMGLFVVYRYAMAPKRLVLGRSKPGGTR